MVKFVGAETGAPFAALLLVAVTGDVVIVTLNIGLLRAMVGTRKWTPWLHCREFAASKEVGAVCAIGRGVVRILLAHSSRGCLHLESILLYAHAPLY